MEAPITRIISISTDEASAIVISLNIGPNGQGHTTESLKKIKGIRLQALQIEKDKNPLPVELRLTEVEWADVKVYFKKFTGWNANSIDMILALEEKLETLL